MNNTKKVIFIGGSSYSGSTMLDMMMANSPDGFSVGEVHALFRPFRPHHFEPECGCGNVDCRFWLQVRDVGEKQLYETIFSLLPDVSFIVDSSKDPWWIQKQVEYLQGKGIEVCHLLIWKEPASFAHSMMKRKRKGWEKAWNNYYRLYFTLIHNYISVPYSALTQNPEQVLQNLCGRCGVEYHKGKEKFWQKQHHTLFGNDSAKVHLGRGDSKNCQHKDTFLGQENGRERRTIYHDTHNLWALSAVINQANATGSDCKSTLLMLNEEGRAGLDNHIRLSSMQVAGAKMRWLLKSITGRSVGRYWRIF